MKSLGFLVVLDHKVRVQCENFKVSQTDEDHKVPLRYIENNEVSQQCVDHKAPLQCRNREGCQQCVD